MLIGYARVSTHDQNLDLQRDALEAAGCDRVIVDRMSGAASARPGLAQIKDVLRAGDTLVVWRLDRLGRSLKDLIAWVGYLDEQQVGLRSLHEAIDTTTPTGKLTFHVFGALAEFERALIRDRTQAGLAAARARGRLGGRRPVLNGDKRALAVKLYNERQTSIARICQMMGISKPTLYSYVRAADRERSSPLPKSPIVSSRGETESSGLERTLVQSAAEGPFEPISLKKSGQRGLAAEPRNNVLPLCVKMLSIGHSLQKSEKLSA